MPRKTVESIQSVGTGLGESPEYLHVNDDRRGIVGVKVANLADDLIRHDARMEGGASEDDACTKPVCMGCALAVYVNAILATAKHYGVTVNFVRDHLNQAFDDLVEDGATRADVSNGYRFKRHDDDTRKNVGMARAGGHAFGDEIPL